MPLPSLHPSNHPRSANDQRREWSIARAAAIGAALGVMTSLFRALDPLHQAGGASATLATGVARIAGAALGFAVLCAAAAALRNFIVRRLVWR
jgi:hypothetical protein